MPKKKARKKASKKAAKMAPEMAPRMTAKMVAKKKPKKAPRTKRPCDCPVGSVPSRIHRDDYRWAMCRTLTGLGKGGRRQQPGTFTQRGAPRCD
jgi:hypothetical protein